MTKKQIKNLALGSYTKNALDIIKAKQIARLLKKSELRQYIKQLKIIEEKKVVRVVVPDKTMLTNNSLSKVKSMFPKKRLIVEEDKQLILGIKVIDNDLIYNLSLNHIFANLNEHIVEQYDK